MTSRRHFLSLVPLAGAAAFARAETPAAADPKDPQAVALGYVADAANVDKAKFPKFAAGQTCANCVLYQGAAGSTSGACPIYQNKLVPAKAWCNAYVKKA